MNIRPRRNRKSAAIRNMVEETKLGVENLIYPIFLKDGKNIKDEVLSLPNNFRWSIDRLLPEIEECMNLGIYTFDIFPAVDEELKDKKLLLYFGFIRDYKGLDLLIESMSLLDDSYHLIIAGEVYGNFDKYSEQISNLEVGHKITQFVKYINDSEVQELFSASDVCVLPYKSATQSGMLVFLTILICL